MSSYTLADIVAAADAKYGNVEVELSDGSVNTMINALQLPKEKRKQLGEFQKEMDAEGSDDRAILERCIVLVSKDPKQAAKLISEIGGNLAVLAELFHTYGKQTQVGEA